MRRFLLGCSALALVLSACECSESGPPPPPTPEQIRATFKKEAQAVTDRFAETLKRELVGAIKAENAAHAISVCKDRAAIVAKEVSTPELAARRIGTRLRNAADNTPTPGQKAALEKLTMDNREFLGEIDGKLTYMRAIHIQSALCLRCHGNKDKMEPAVIEKLTELYPDDQATGHDVGDLRGAFVVVKQ